MPLIAHSSARRMVAGMATNGMPHHRPYAKPSKIFLRASRLDWSAGRFRLTRAISSQNLFGERIKRTNECPPVISHRTGPGDFSQDGLKARALHREHAVAFEKSFRERSLPLR
jgi:hypothetical protein